MRAIDTLEKVCRTHPNWIEPYIDDMLSALTACDQLSIQWHLAQIFKQIQLSYTQRKQVIHWLLKLLSTSKVDWIVAANAIDTLAVFTKDGFIPKSKLTALLKVQLSHKSSAVVKRSNKFLAEFS